MNTKQTFQAAILAALFMSTAIISSCGSDDEDDMDMDMEEEVSDDEVSLNFTLGGTAETAVFETNSLFLATSNGAVTVISTSGALESGKNYAFAITYNGTSTGTFNLTQGAGDGDEDIEGLSLVILDGQDSESYVAKNVSLSITSYTVISLAEIIVKGTFSGTLEGEETQQEIAITNGSFVTGFKE